LVFTNNLYFLIFSNLTYIINHISLYFTMGKEQSKQPPPPPPPTVKEMVKAHSKTLRKMRSEFQREIKTLEMNQKKIRSEMEQMIKKKEPRSTVKIIAANLIKN